MLCRVVPCCRGRPAPTLTGDRLRLTVRSEAFLPGRRLVELEERPLLPDVRPLLFLEDRVRGWAESCRRLCDLSAALGAALRRGLLLRRWLLLRRFAPCCRGRPALPLEEDRLRFLWRAEAAMAESPFERWLLSADRRCLSRAGRSLSLGEASRRLWGLSAALVTTRRGRGDGDICAGGPRGGTVSFSAHRTTAGAVGWPCAATRSLPRAALTALTVP